MNLYDEAYFNTLNYTDYLGRKDKYKRLAKETTDLLSVLGLISEKSHIFDYGCAVGFLLEALTELGYQECYGYDISEWACAIAREKGVKLLSNHIAQRKFDVMYCLDVLEHMTERQICYTLGCFSARALIVRIPVSTNGGESFHLEVSNKDKTHVSCHEKDWWVNALRKYGDYKVFLPLNLYTIWDSPGVMCCLALR